MTGRERKQRLLAGLLLTGALFPPLPASADDLRSALAAAYNTNPTLQAQRAQQRATDEGVPLARANGLPSLTASASETEFVKQNPLSGSELPRMLGANATLTVPVYSGGGVRNAIHAAETRVQAGKDDLRATEGNVFAQAVAAYLDVMRTEAIVRLNKAQVDTLKFDLSMTSDRFQIGDLTRTDVAQSQSRLAVAQGNLRTAEANLVSARETYIQIIGKPPENLASPPPLTGLPASVEDAVGIALDNSPDLSGARQRAKAAGYDVSSARASRLPKVSLFADGNYTNYLGSLSFSNLAIDGIPQHYTAADVGVRATIPLYQGGGLSAQVRQAQAIENQAQEQSIGTERAVIAQARSAWSTWKAANDVIADSQIAVDSAQLSLEGVRAENSVGNRTVLDILNAEQELVNAQVTLVTARRNAYVAGFNLLVTMGRAQARDLGFEDAAIYDPDRHYQQARHTLWDWGEDPKTSPKSTRTVDTPAQSGSIP
ncbi:MAG: TolC family outer membrane protein [Sphingomonadales bacterium]|nr:TolC family outer membrane protein [Sphingomonadales bacterium]MDE2170815.1 TolC family outer membrane protein [Sphingomonadales bacterium]